jgi:hypothetical protein
MAWGLRFTGTTSPKRLEITTPIPASLNITFEIDFKADDVSRNQILLGGQYSLYNNSHDVCQIGVDSAGKVYCRFGGTSSAKSDSSISAGTYYRLKFVVTGLSATDDVQQGLATLYLDDVAQADTFVPKSNPFRSGNSEDKPNWLGSGGHLAEVKNPFDGDIFRVRMTGDTYDYHWQPNSSDRTNTGAMPIIVDTIAGNNFVGEDGFATDGSDWIEDPSIGDDTPPNYTVVPAITATTSSGHTISATLDESGTVYAVRLDNGASAPTSEQVKAGTDAADVALSADDKKTSAATAATNVDLVFTNGAASTSYDYYYTAEDDEGTPNLRASPTLVEGTTSATTQAITITGGDLEAGNTEAGTYTNMTGVAATGTVTDSEGNQFSVTVTDGNDNTMTVAVPALPTSGTSNLGLFGNVTLQIDEAP